MQRVKNVFILFLLTLSISALGQKNERIQYKADELFEFREKGEKRRKLTGNVVFSQEGTIMYCDSSLFYVKKNVMEAFGNVRIVDDSTTITANRGIYDGKNKIARLRENVIYTNGEKQLFTDNLDYNTETEVANYFNWGKLKDSTNTLSSEIGFLYSLDDYAFFSKGVNLEAPDYTLTSDTLRYNTETKVATTNGKTIITNEDGSVLHAKGGEFRTEDDQSEFVDGNIETEDYYMEGDEIYFDDLNQYYTSKGNVRLLSKEDDVTIYGDEGFTNKKTNTSKVWGHAYMERIMDNDTFYVAADTLVSYDSEYDSAERILAYNNVKLWRFNLQGVADSAAYFLSDSLVFLYNDPIIWNRDSQIEGDTITLEVTKEEIKKMDLLQNSFLISQDTVDNFNQVKGRTMEAFFVESQIHQIDVNGNGEAIYYVLDESDPNQTTTMGMNRILCSDLTIRFVNQELDNISFYKKPDAKFIPPHELTSDQERLKGFNWRIELRPTLAQVLYEESYSKGEQPADEDEDKETKLLPPVRLEKEGVIKKNDQLLKKPKSKEE